MARPPKPATVAALDQRLKRLEQIMDGLDDLIISEPPRLRSLIAELDALLGLTPGTLSRRIKESLAKEMDKELCEMARAGGPAGDPG